MRRGDESPAREHATTPANVGADRGADLGTYQGSGGRIAHVVGPCEVILVDGSHWCGSRRPLPWTRRGTWRRGDVIRVLRVRGVRAGEDFLLVNAARRCRFEDLNGPIESRMHAAFVGTESELPVSGWRRLLGRSASSS